MGKSLAVTSAAAVALCLCATGSASAYDPGRDPMPMKLPPADAHISSAIETTWLLGIEPLPAARARAHELGASAVSGNAVSVPTGRARAVAAALRRDGYLAFAEPDIVAHTASAPDGRPGAWARGSVMPGNMLTVPVGLAPIGIVDERIDVTHPDLAGHTTVINPGGAIEEGHGTAVASVAAGTMGNGFVMGIVPGQQVVGYATNLTCSDITRGIDRLQGAGVKVINLSLGFSGWCQTLYVMIQKVIGADTVVVAAAGNEFEEGNPIEFPAAFPHVLSVAAIDRDRRSSYFSNANAAVDVSAAGEGVPVAVPIGLDTEDGVRDGVSRWDGTSFSAPIVAGVVSWLRTVRPRMNGQQIVDLVRRGARDIDRRGWDADTGWGMVDLPASLRQPDPMPDPRSRTTRSSWSTERTSPAPTASSIPAADREGSRPRWTGRRIRMTSIASASPRTGR